MCFGSYFMDINVKLHDIVDALVMVKEFTLCFGV